ncbi:hypothetical protein BSKO_02181 [Bryopsis sp. KO-2023]|nr:hypothetical protein BSKO_02181 [Bryopsis sp. KO-2023]
MFACSRIPSRLWPVAVVSHRACGAPRPHARRAFSTAVQVTPARVVVPVGVTAAQRNPTSKLEKDKRKEKTFGELLHREDVLCAVEEAGFITPTEIQAKGIPAILSGRDVVLASHTGSGKTLAYLLPLVEKLKMQEGHSEIRTKRPRVLVMGPTRELTDQILQVAKSISHHSKFRSTLLNGGGKMKTQREKLAMPQDLVVATPARLKEHVDARNVFFGDVEVLVLDEADTMFDAGFGPEVKKIVEILSKKPTKCQFVLVAATMGKGIRKLIKGTFTDLLTVETSSLHKGVKGSEHKFFTLQPGTDKLTQLNQLLETDVRNSKRVMVFCNTMDSCRAVEHTLAELGVQTLCYHGDMPIDARKETIHKFSGLSRHGGDRDEQEDSPKILVCTDLAARGLDIPQRVDHVINFDFPKSPIDYIHRGGRTARAGASGRVTSLVHAKDRTLADRISWAIKRDLPLDELSRHKHVTPPSMRSKQEKKNPRQVRADNSMKGTRGANRVNLMKERSKKASQDKAASKKMRRKQILARNTKSKAPKARQ